jgi:hypothetical protein
MTALMLSPVVLVTLQESTVALLMAQRQRDDETLDAEIARLAGYRLLSRLPAIGIPPLPSALEDRVSAPTAEEQHGLELFGAETLRAATLPELHVALIDRFDELDSEANEKIAALRSRKRAYISRDKNAIHPGRPDLPVRRSQSGWRISANIGRRDLWRTLKATCTANDLVYGHDIRYRSLLPIVTSGLGVG